jgi:hypothetical protein
MSTPAKQSRTQQMEPDTHGTPQKMDVVDGAASSGGSSGGAGGDALGAAKHDGQPIIPHGRRGLKPLHHYEHTYTKKFYTKIYANDWVTLNPGHDGATNILGFMTVIPWHALCMYISPDEYLDIIRNCSYAKLEETVIQLRLKAVRTPFDANSTDVAEANGNLNFEFKRWDGLEMMLPFKCIDVEGTPASPSYVDINGDYSELIQRLYGNESLAYIRTNSTPVPSLPATMRERGLSWRPQWLLVGNNTAQWNAPNDGIYERIQRYISSIPVGEYETDSVNTNVSRVSEGYCFNKVYRPKNGILSFAPSQFQNDGTAGVSRINTKERFSDTIAKYNGAMQPPITNINTPQYLALFPNITTTSNSNILAGTGPLITINSAKTINCDNELNFGIAPPTACPTPSQIVCNAADHGIAPAAINPTPGTLAGVAALPATINIKSVWPNITNATVNSIASGTADNYGYAYINGMQSYIFANVENYQTFTSRNDPPIHHMESMLLGAIPKTNKDGSIVNATFEFEITTMAKVKMQTSHNVYHQLAYFNGNGKTYNGTAISGFANSLSNAAVYGTRWVANETDVALFDNKIWNNVYGLAGKPEFISYPFNELKKN